MKKLNSNLFLLKAVFLSIGIISSSAGHAIPKVPNPDFSSNAQQTFCGNPPSGTGCTFGSTVNKLGSRWGTTQNGSGFYQELYNAYSDSADVNEYITCTAIFGTPDPVSCIIQCGAESQMPATCDGVTPQYIPQSPGSTSSKK